MHLHPLDVSPWTKSWSSRWKQKHSLDHHHQLCRLYCGKNLAVAGPVETGGTMRICQCCNNNLGPKWSFWSRCFKFNRACSVFPGIGLPLVDSTASIGLSPQIPSNQISPFSYSSHITSIIQNTLPECLSLYFAVELVSFPF